MNFQQLQNRVWTWCEKKFGDKSSLEGRIEHLIEEVEDLKDNPYNISSQADIYILMMAISKETGFSMDEISVAVEAKQTINETREWGDPDAKGIIRHIKSTNV